VSEKMMTAPQLPPYPINPSASIKPDMGVVHKIAWWLTLLLVFLLPWGNGLWDGIAKIVGLLLFAFAGLLLVTQGTHRHFNFFNLMALILGCWHLIALIWSPAEEAAIKAANTFTQLVLVSLVYTYMINDIYKLRGAYLAYVIGAMVAFGIIFSNFLRGIEGPYFGRYTIENIETDSMAIILSLAIPMAVWLFREYKNPIVKLACLGCVPVLFYGIFLTGTRTGLVTGMVGLMYLVFTQRKASFNLKLFYIASSIAFVTVFLSLAPKASVERIFSIGQAIETGDLNSREIIWQYSLESWKEQPIIGGGTGSLGNSLNRYHINFDSAHNSYIQLITEHGVIGLGIYFLMFGSLLYYILQCPIETKLFLLTLFLTIAVSQLALHSHKVKEVWFVWSIIAAHGHFFARMKGQHYNYYQYYYGEQPYKA